MSNFATSTSSEHRITLTAPENDLFQLIEDCLIWKGIPTVPRVAGGWVRDKLLGLPSDDIDIALDDQTGVTFANTLKEYLSHKGMEVRSIAVFQANPEQSKHLETVNLHIGEFQIDFVNLRAESYTSESRIPIARFGTPRDDAQRRDFTMNALFYNLLTKQVEDFTGQGIEDLQKGLIRTPLPAMDTIIDDPLRLLRAIRFASRFSFELHEDIVRAAVHPTIHTAIRTKVSKERVLKEMDSMMKCTRPLLAVVYMYRCNLLDVLLQPPVHADATAQFFSGDHRLAGPDSALYDWTKRSMDITGWLGVLLRLRRLNGLCLGEPEPVVALEASGEATSASTNLAATASDSDVSGCRFSLEQLTAPSSNCRSTRDLYWASLLSGLSRNKVSDGLRTKPVVEVILKDNLKMDTDTINTVNKLFDGAYTFISMLQSQSEAIHILSQGLDQSSLSVQQLALIAGLREEIGLILKEIKSNWRSSIMLASAILISKSQLPSEVALNASAFCDKTSSSEREVVVTEEIKSIIQKCVVIQNIVISQGLDGCWTWKPIMDGNQLLKALRISGPAIGKATKLCYRWQLRHPAGSVEEALVFLRANAAELA